MKSLMKNSDIRLGVVVTSLWAKKHLFLAFFDFSHMRSSYIVRNLDFLFKIIIVWDIEIRLMQICANSNVGFESYEIINKG